MATKSITIVGTDRIFLRNLGDVSMARGFYNFVRKIWVYKFNSPSWLKILTRLYTVFIFGMFLLTYLTIGLIVKKLSNSSKLANTVLLVIALIYGAYYSVNILSWFI